MDYIQIGLHTFGFVIAFTYALKYGWFGTNMSRRCTLRFDANASQQLMRVLSRIEAGELVISSMSASNIELKSSGGTVFYVCIADINSKTFGWVSDREFMAYSYGIEVQNQFIDYGAVNNKAYKKLMAVLHGKEIQETNKVQLS